MSKVSVLIPAYNEELSLPISPAITLEEVAQVVELINKFK
mgnify:CR=1 FL=1